MLSFAICDDNVGVLNKLSILLKAIFEKNDLAAKIAFKTTNPVELLNYVKENSIDVLILDINLNSSINGIDVANEVD